MKSHLSKIYFFAVIALALAGQISSPIALGLGFIFTLFFKHPFLEKSQKSINFLLKTAVIGLGFGMALVETIQTSVSSFGLTLFCVFFTVSFGLILSRYLHLDKSLGHLITSGTSICGGSAIAAISPIIKADTKTITMALGVVFFLNAVALIVFPYFGHLIGLNQHQFGLWCAVAIHDTSSVVGAALNYGEEALNIATTVKLSRTLWIIPMSIVSMFLFKNSSQKIKFPLFILLFVAAILIHSADILPEIITTSVVSISKHLLVVTLFLVGTTMSVSDLKKTGWKPMAFASTLWIFVSVISLFYILYFSI
ncbi:YeiH family protein [Formosa sp. PL04]|uniref:YeiH family protein n=1 Tax=Formosa sp. PL04 TaxID=3081755 RepID=UPI002980C1C8|nr:putative sulfate exporter family transporter [Formosa sp. PL04]MDW5291005.1 putative sulfate exporter family transporter [Formosa sp. PL04]